jgi:hypothetical protein
MFHIKHLDLLPVTLDFSTSDGGRLMSTAVDGAGVRLVTAINLVEFDPDATQVHVCSHCGSIGCESGNWVSLRRLGDLVLWIPAFARMETGEWERDQYSPPGFMANRGIAVFLPEAWKQFRSLRLDAPNILQLPPLNSREAVRVLQWSAPRRILGRYPERPRIDREGILAVTTGEIETEVQVVDLALDEYFESQDHVGIVSETQVGVPFEFWLDLPGVPSWRPFIRNRSEAVLLLDRDLAVSRRAATIP